MASSVADVQPPTRTGPRRIAALDVARGVAILGTLATNVWIFSDPGGYPGFLAHGVPRLTDGVAAAVEVVARQLANGKFLGMLTLMFGVGLAIQHRSARRRGLSWPGRYPWRGVLLLLDGVLHFVLVVEFDVLTGYAVTGIVVAFVLATSERARRRWLRVTVAVHVVLISLLTAGAWWTGQVAAVPSGLRTLYTGGSWWDQVRFRVTHLELTRAEPVLIAAMSIALFLLGSRLYEAGLFDERGRRLRRRLLLLGAVALPVDLAVGGFGGVAGLLFSRYLTGPVVALGVLGAVAMLSERTAAPGAVQRRLAAVGRTSLSCYVFQNVVCSIACYGWGLGLAGRLAAYRPWWTFALYAAVAGLVVVVANLWTRRFARGPLEASWARLYALPWRDRRA